MEFRKLTVKNFCQHTFAEMSIPRGITGVIGPNGRGKSNLSQVGLLYALTGLTVGTTTKKDLIKWGATNFQTTLLFYQNSLDYTLKRSSNSASLNWVEDGEAKLIKGSTGVDEYLVTLLGMPMLVIKETCFASQGTLLDIISMTHTKRIEYFQKVCGTRVAEIIRGILQNTLNDIPNYIDRSETIKDIDQTIKDTEKDYTLISSKYNLLKDELSQMSSAIKEATNYLDKPSEFEFKEYVADISGKLKHIEERLAKETIEYPYEDICITQERRDIRRSYLDNAAVVNQLEKVKKELKDILAQDKPIVAKDEYDEALSIVQECLQIYTSLAKQYDLVSRGTCPTCGQDFKQNPEDIKPKLDEAKEIYEMSKKEKDIIEKRYHKCIKDLMSYEYTYKDITKRLINLEDLFVDDIEHDEELYQLDLEKDEKLNNRRRDALKYKDVRDKLNKEYAILKTGLLNYKQCGYLSNKSKVEFESILDKYTKNTETLNNYKTDMKVKEIEINSKNTMLKVYVKEQKEFEKSKDDIKVLETCRDVLHREYLPKMVMSRIVGRLNRHILSYLEKFSTNFIGYLTTDFDFFVDYVTGDREKPAKSLSGGQKVALAIAFRFALADLLGATVPLLALDEPTVHLDDDNVECVASVLETAKTKIKSGMHMVIATHQPLLMRGFSQIIEI